MLFEHTHATFVLNAPTPASGFKAQSHYAFTRNMFEMSKELHHCMQNEHATHFVHQVHFGAHVVNESGDEHMKIDMKNADTEYHVQKLAAEARICLRTWWKRMWRLHVGVARESVQRVLACGSVHKAMQNTSLAFFIGAYRAQLQGILDARQTNVFPAK